MQNQKQLRHPTMKSPAFPHRRRLHGFTLIELLVVIVIIAILVGLSVPVYNLVLEKMNKTKTKFTMQSILTAAKQYETEYNRYPIDPSLNTGAGGEDMEALLTDGTGDANSPINILMAQNGDDSPNMNSKKIKYVDLPQARNGLFGIVQDGGSGAADDSSTIKLMDTWGQPYRIQFDTNYDNRIENPDKQNNDQVISGRATDYLTTTAIMYSIGKDREEFTKDDIVSWRD
jgi:prepilin-type N-terminal cleavage/methylation domain-containing protein